MVGVRAAMIDDVIVAQMRHAVTQLVSDLNDALRKQVGQAPSILSDPKLVSQEERYGGHWWKRGLVAVR